MSRSTDLGSSDSGEDDDGEENEEWSDVDELDEEYRELDREENFYGAGSAAGSAAGPSKLFDNTEIILDD